MEVAPKVVDRLVMQEVQSFMAEIQEGLRPVASRGSESYRGTAGWSSDEDYTPEAAGSMLSRSPSPPSRQGSRASLREEELSFSSRLRPLGELRSGDGTDSQALLGAGASRSRLIRRNSMVEGGTRGSRSQSRRTSFVGSDTGSELGAYASISEVGSDQGMRLPGETRVRYRRVSNASLIVRRLANTDQSMTPHGSQHPSVTDVVSVLLDGDE
jgi:hypothetical protein